MRSKAFSLFTTAVLLVALESSICFARRGGYTDLLLNEILDDGSGDVNELVTSDPDIEIPIDTGLSGTCSRATRKNTDDFIDKVLNEVRPKLPEPAFLPDRIGRFKLFNGTLENLASLERQGPALMRCTDSTFSFLVPIGLNNLTGLYFWELDSGLPVFRGFIDMFIRRAEADVLYTRQRKDSEDSTEETIPQKAMIENLKITKLEGVQVKFDGLGALNRVASRFTNLVARYFSRGVARVLEGPVKTAINKELRNVEKYEKYYF